MTECLGSATDAEGRSRAMSTGGTRWGSSTGGKTKAPPFERGFQSGGTEEPNWNGESIMQNGGTMSTATMKVRNLFGWNVPVGLPVKVEGQPIGHVTESTRINHPGSPGWIVTMEVADCRKCDRRIDGWRWILFWRQWHRRRCPISRMMAGLKAGELSRYSFGRGRK